jgi:flagellar hook-length control protein FliK
LIEAFGKSKPAQGHSATNTTSERSLVTIIANVASGKDAGSANAGSTKSTGAPISHGRPGENVPPGRPQDLQLAPGFAVAQSRTSDVHTVSEDRHLEPEPFNARAEPEQRRSLAGQATVLAHQNIPAPALPPSQTAVSLAGSIASDGGWRQVLSAPTTVFHTTSSAALPAQSLKIELHPAELGTVTANLKLAGGQLSIEITPETHDAHRKLSSDSDAIVASLRGLGFDVDKVAVLQPSIATHGSARGDAVGAQAGPAGRDQSGSQPGNPGSGGGSGGQQSGRSYNENRQDHARTAPSPRDRAGGDLFI